MYRAQQGVLAHVLGGWSVSGTYFLASGQPYTPVPGSVSCSSGGGSCDSAQIDGNPYDGRYNNAFVGADGALRPFLGSNSAPVSTVGIFAGDICATDTADGALCGNLAITPTALISLNGVNNGLIGTKAGPPDAMGNPTVVPDPNNPAKVVTNQDVRFIANTATANAVFGTPFSNVGRNTLRDARSNISNLSYCKPVNIPQYCRTVCTIT